MQRTSIMLPNDLKEMAEERAHETGRSLGQVIRDALFHELLRKEMDPKSDSLLEDTHYFTDETPVDLSANHDQYLYGDKL